jgi:hypothetical protein
MDYYQVMTKKPKISHTLIKGLLVGLMPFVIAGMDIRFNNAPVAQLAKMLVPLIWLTLLVWHIRAAKEAKLEVATNLNGQDGKLENQELKEPIGIKKPKLTDTILKTLFITIGMLVVSWIAFELDNPLWGLLGVVVYLIPFAWWWMMVDYLRQKNISGYGNRYGHADFNFSNSAPMQYHGGNPTEGPVMTEFQHNELSRPTYHTPMMTRTPDYSFEPGSGMYVTRWD